MATVDLNHATALVHPQAWSRLRDKFGRAITDLRVSVTDRCNFKCVYCRTGTEGPQFAELSREDYLRLIRSCTRLLCRDAPTTVVKFRAGGIHLADLFHQAYPDARNIFLYRHAERWLESMHAGFTRRP